MKIRKPSPGEIWYHAQEGAHFLVAGADRTHAVVCQVAIRRDGHPVAHPRGRKADRVLVRDFTNGLYEYIGTAKAVATSGR